MTYALRRMTETDIEDVSRIISAHHSADGRLAREYYEEYFSSPEDCASEREDSIVAVEAGSGEVVGVSGFYPDKYDWPTVLWLNWFYVGTAHQGGGVGRLLMDRVLEDVRRLGVSKLYLDTSSDETYARAVDMYKKYGFVEEGCLVDYYAEGENYLILGKVMGTGS